MNDPGKLRTINPVKQDLAKLRMCEQNFGQMWYKHKFGRITDDEWEEWFSTHCEKCAYYKGACYK